MKKNVIVLILALISLNIYAKQNPVDSLCVGNNFDEQSLSYKIQIGVFFQQNIDSAFFSSLCCILIIEKNSQNTKILIGNYETIEKARYALDVVRKKIVSDAFIVPYLNNNRVSFSEIK